MPWQIVIFVKTWLWPSPAEPCLLDESPLLVVVLQDWWLPVNCFEQDMRRWSLNKQRALAAPGFMIHSLTTTRVGGMSISRCFHPSMPAFELTCQRI